MNKAHMITSPWPHDLVKHCPCCGYSFDARVNIDYGRFGMAETLKKIAWWAPLPSFPIALMICLTYPDRGFIMAVALGTIMPAILLNLSTLLFPFQRRLRCWECGYEEFASKKEWKQP